MLKAFFCITGAFFIPYTIFLAFVGIPIFFMELSLGQYGSNGPVTCWKFAPLFTGKKDYSCVCTITVSETNGS